MNDVVREARMIWVLRGEIFEDGAGFFLIGIGLIANGSGCANRQGVENGRFAIVGIARVNLAHGILIGECTSGVGALVGVLVEDGDGGDVVALALRFCASAFGPSNCSSA